jgi:Na+/H+ antiporter NhaC
MITLATWLGEDRTIVALIALLLAIMFFASWMTRGLR